ncbi:MAG: tRNA (guanosine(46)-N7)-methyltransferase TrmB [Candidatus Cloacimonadaceae bacterium]
MLEDRDFFVIEDAAGLILNEVFPTPQPLYLEIGSGKGEFISRYPQLYPKYNFIGLEMSEKRIRNCLKKLVPELNPNVRLFRKYVDADILQYFAPHSVAGVFIQHPDPWPKRRHHRRRLIQAIFLESLAKLLSPGGTVQIATDHAEYAAWIVDIFAQSPHFSSLQESPIQMQPNLDNHVSTWFEYAQRKIGYEPHFMLYKSIFQETK